MLHVGLVLPRHAREAAGEARHPRRLEAAQLVLVDEVLPGMAAAKEQERGADRLALGLPGGALLQEAPEGGEAGPGADHDDRRRRVLGQAERRLRVLHERLDGAALRLLEEIAGTHPLVDAVPRARRALDHGHRDAAAPLLLQGRRGDRVVARAERREHVEVHRERRRAGRILLEQVDERRAPGQHLFPVAGLVGGEGGQPRPGPRALGVLLGQGLDLPPRRHLLQLDVVAEQARHRDRLAEGEERLAMAGGAEPDVGGRVQPEPGGHAGDHRHRRCGGSRRGDRRRGRSRRPGSASSM